MLERTFREEMLSEDFSKEIQRLFDAVAEGGGEAIQRLAEMGAPAVDPLCEALDDPRRPVRNAAARALYRIGYPRALRPVLQLLHSDAGGEDPCRAEPVPYGCNVSKERDKVPKG